jgi:alpha,alpha-trehalase
MLDQEYADCLKYIHTYWKRIIKNPKEAPSNNGFLKLPHHYITPNDKKFTYLFYWDTFFMFRGLIGTEHASLMKEVIENYVFLLKRYGIIPNFNSHASPNRSQPPFFTSMIFDVYNQTKGKKSLTRRMEWAKWEYEHVWLDQNSTYNHSVQGFGLSRYGDRDVGYAHSSELESGWDFTSRFYNRCNDSLPIDLNCLLYKYETDFAKAAGIVGNVTEQKAWLKKAEKRKKEINTYMWNEEKGFFFDYDYVRNQQSNFYSLAGFVPLWVGLASPKQAFRMIMHIDKFESKYGLLITAKESLPERLQETIDKIEQEDYRHQLFELVKPKQWDYPNIWPPVEYMAVIGMLKYGLLDEAKRIMKKSLIGEAKVFRKYGSFFEKMNGVTGDAAASYHYINQGGFGWTNAVFYRYVQILDHMKQHGDDSIYSYPMRDNPPYDLGIPV